MYYKHIQMNIRFILVLTLILAQVTLQQRGFSSGSYSGGYSSSYYNNYNSGGYQTYGTSNTTFVFIQHAQVLVQRQQWLSSLVSSDVVVLAVSALPAASGREETMLSAKLERSMKGWKTEALIKWMRLLTLKDFGISSSR